MTVSRYQKEKPLSPGDVATTWRAKDSRTGFSVAVKEVEIPTGDDATWEALEPLQRARESLECLRHAGVPTMLDHYDEGTTHGLVCEWVDGRPLSSHLHSDAPLPTEEAWKLLEAGLEILSHLHTRSPPVVHGDVHPDNLLVDAAGQLHIVGFPGIDQVPAIRMAVETPPNGPCAAPEVARGEAGPASDLYALGISLCAAITGTAVEELPSVPGWGGKRLVLDRVLPSTPLRDVLQSLVEPDRRRRPGSVEDARRLVQAALDRDALLRVAEDKTTVARKRAADERGQVRDETHPTERLESETTADRPEPVLPSDPQAPDSLEVHAPHDDHDDEDDEIVFARRSPPWALLGAAALVIVIGGVWSTLGGEGEETEPAPPPTEASPGEQALKEGGGAADETASGTEAAEELAASLKARCARLRDNAGLGAWRQLLKDAPDAPCAREGRAAVLSGLDQPAVRPVDKGTVIVGSRGGTEDDDRSPSIQIVELTRAYAVTTTEVTEHLYREVMGEQAPTTGTACALCPVQGVSWWDAVRFSNALSTREGLAPAYAIDGATVKWDPEATGYRLPTAAEWEHAARSLDWPSGSPPDDGPAYVATDSMTAGVAEWVWDSHAPSSGRRSGASNKGRVDWSPAATPPDGFDPGGPRTPVHHPKCVQGGSIVGPDFPGGPGFASSVPGGETFRAPLGRKRRIAVEPPGNADVGAVVTIRHGRTDKLRRRLTGHTNTQVFARALGNAWIFSFAVDGELRLWDPRKGKLRSTDRYLGGDLSSPGDPTGQIYVAQANRDHILVMSPRFLTLWKWNRKNPRASAFKDLIPPAWDPAVVGGFVIGPDGQIASVKDDVVTLWATDGKEIARLEDHDGPIRGANPISTDLLATWGEDHTVRLWSWAGDARGTLAGHEQEVVCVEDLGRNRLVSRDRGGRAVLWNIRNAHALGVIAPLQDGERVLVSRPGVKPFKQQLKHQKRRLHVDPAPNDAEADRTIRGAPEAPVGARQSAPADTRRAGLGFRIVRNR